ncbi:hypothetical protein Tco_0837974 [Tanacetum coccineum]
MRQDDFKSGVCYYPSDSSDSNDSDSGHWKVTGRGRYRNRTNEDLSLPWCRDKVDAFAGCIRRYSEDKKRRMPTNVKTYDGIGDPDWLSTEETPATRIPPNAPRRPTNFVTEEVPETNEVGNPDFSWEEFAAKYCDNLAPFITPSTGANGRRSLLSRLSFDHEQPDLFSIEEESGDPGNSTRSPRNNRNSTPTHEVGADSRRGPPQATSTTQERDSTTSSDSNHPGASDERGLSPQTPRTVTIVHPWPRKDEIGSPTTFDELHAASQASTGGGRSADRKEGIPATWQPESTQKAIQRPRWWQSADAAGRLQKWSVLLGEHNISYRPRTVIKGGLNRLLSRQNLYCGQRRIKPAPERAKAILDEVLETNHLKRAYAGRTTSKVGECD